MNDEAKLLYTLNDTWQDAGDLAAKLGCSEKTIRTRLHHLQAEINPEYAEIRTVKGKGTRLIVKNATALQSFLHQKYTKELNLPDTAEDRRKYILHALLTEKKWIRREDLSMQLLVSEKTISKDLKVIDALLTQYDLCREMKPGYGMHVTGSEFSFRQCILNHIVSIYDEKDDNVTEILNTLLDSCFKENNLNLPEYLKTELRDYLALSIHRIRQGFDVVDQDIADWPQNVGVYYLSRYLFDSMVNSGLISQYNSAEPYYASFYLWGNRVVNEKSGEIQNYIVPRHTRKIALELLDFLQKKYNLNVNEALTEGLIHHTLEVEIRCRYHIRMVCPYSRMLERDCPAAYLAGIDAVQFIAGNINHHVSREEPGFYAMLLEPYIPDKYKKISAYMIWNTEMAEDHFLYDLLKKEFADCIIFASDDDQQQLDQYDLVFTTNSTITGPNVILTDYSLLDGDFSQFRDRVRQIVKQILQSRYF